MAHAPNTRENRHWYDIFKMRTKEKKKLYKELIESNNGLAMALADQTRRSATLDGQIEELTRQLTASAARLAEAIQARDKTKAKYNTKKLALQELRTNTDEAEIASKTNLADLKEWNRKLASEKDHVTSILHETEDQLDTLQDKYKNLKTEREQMVATNNELQKELLSAEEAVREEQLQYQRVEKEFIRTSDKYEYLREEHTQMATSSDELRKRLLSSEKVVKEGQLRYQLLEKEYKLTSDALVRLSEDRAEEQKVVEDLRRMIHVLKKEKHQLQQALSTQTRALRLQAAMVSRQLEKSNVRVEQMQNDKLNLICYFQDKLTRSQDTTRTGPGMMPDKSTILFPDYPQVEYLQNKVYNLEFQLYRQSQLIQELTALIVSHDPDFDLHSNPHLNIYMDNTGPSVDNTVLGDICVEDITPEDDGEDIEAQLVMNAILESTEEQDESYNAKPYREPLSDGNNQSTSAQGEPEIKAEIPHRMPGRRPGASHSPRRSIFALTNIEDADEDNLVTRV